VIPVRTVMVFGTFDILHPGHLYYLKRARALGDRLIVVVGRDASVKAIKGRSPVFGERDRLLTMRALRSVDKAVLGNAISGREDAFGIIAKYRPDVIALGHDQWASVVGLRKWLAGRGLKARVVRIRSSLDKSAYSSSRIRRRRDRHTRS
jgi:FAD synthetase